MAKYLKDLMHKYKLEEKFKELKLLTDVLLDDQALLILLGHVFIGQWT